MAVANRTDTLRRVLIIGAGPGGLSAAIALQRVGIKATVFERASKLGTVGGGLGVQSNALRALQRLGLGDELIAAGSEIRSNVIHDGAGRPVFELPQGEVADEFGTPTIMVLRADVQRALARAVDDDALVLESECTGVEQNADGVSAHFADGRSERGALVIGADGIHSVVRNHVYPDGGAPLRYAGLATWRGVAQLDGVLPVDTAWYFNGPGRQFVMFPVGQGRIYWGVMYAAAEGGSDPAGRVRDQLSEYLSEFPEVVRQVIWATPEVGISRTDLYDRNPSGGWVKGRVVLLGDAAHLTTPFIGQGAGISLEDSVVLAKELSLTAGLRDQSMLDVALESYQRVRVPRCSKVVLTSRRRGTIYLISNPVLARARDGILRRLPHAVRRDMVKRSIVYDV
jgi:FAD-dependent urate hydroxylase